MKLLIFLMFMSCNKLVNETVNIENLIKFNN